MSQVENSSSPPLAGRGGSTANNSYHSPGRTSYTSTTGGGGDAGDDRIDAIKLDFRNKELYGRHEELTALRNVYNSIRADTTSTFRGDLVFVHGKAGSGKTALVETLRDEWMSNSNENNSNNNHRNYVLYARAKFELPPDGSSSSSANLEPIARACADLCDAVSSNLSPSSLAPSSASIDTLRQDLVDELGLGIKAFQKFVPNSAQLLQQQHQQQQQQNEINISNSNNNSNNTGASVQEDADVVIREERAFERLKVLIGKFISVMCGTTKKKSQNNDNTTSHRQPNMVVLFFDDIQWADEGCLDILRHLAAGQQKGLLLIVAQRDADDDDDEDKPNQEGNDQQSTQRIPDQLASLQNDGITITYIPIKELDMEGVKDIICGITGVSASVDNEPIRSLANVVYQKTRGNAFFVTQFLRSIEEEGFLYYSARYMKWTWDLESIESLTSVSDNVVEFVAQKIQKLPASAQAALTIAACLGSTIHTSIVDYLARTTGLFSAFCGISNSSNINNNNNNTKELDGIEWINVFDFLANEGFVNKRKRGSRAYVWSHDRILESAYQLIPSSMGDGQKQKIHLEIGQALHQLDDCPLGESWKLITSTDQLNRASSIFTSDSRQRVELAEMNLQAAKTVASVSAFYQAARYLRTGIDLLDPSTMWEEHYELCLELHNSLAEIEKYVGHHEACRLIAKQVLENGNTLNDKFRSYMVLIDSLGVCAEFQELMEWVHSLMDQLGEPLPREPTKFCIFMKSRKTLQMIGKKTDDQLLGMPVLTDDRVLKVLSLMSLLHRFTWNAGKIPLTDFIRLRMMQLCVRHGCNDFSGPAFALFGSFLSRMGKLSEASRFGALALNLCKRFPIEETQTSTYVYLHLEIIKKPVRHSIEPLLRAHRSGVEKGDSTVSGALAYIVFYFYQGLPLEPMQEDARAFAIQMAQFGNQAYAIFVNFFRQLALNFMGRSENFLVLTGEAIDYVKVEQLATEQQNYVMFLFSWTSQLVLACFSGDQKLSIAMFDKLANAELLPEHYPGPAILGLVAVFLTRSTGERKFARKAKAVLKQLNGLLKKGSVNYLFFLLLIKAELASNQRTNRMKTEATKLFQAAVRAAAQTGLTNFEALATARFGMFALERDEGDTFWAQTYLSRSVSLYSEWGATSMVDLLKLKFPLLTSDTSGLSVQPSNTRHMGRRRLDENNAFKRSFRQSELVSGRRRLSFDDQLLSNHNETVTDSPRE